MLTCSAGWMWVMQLAEHIRISAVPRQPKLGRPSALSCTYSQGGVVPGHQHMPGDVLDLCVNHPWGKEERHLKHTFLPQTRRLNS